MRLLLALASTLLLSLNLIGQSLPIQRAYSYHSLQFDAGGAVSTAYDPLSQRLFSVNAAEQKIDILKISDIAKSYRAGRIDLSNYGGKVNSVASHDNLVAVAMSNNFPQAAGKVVFFDTLGTYINQLTIGANPIKIAFSPSLQHFVTVNQGDPSDDYTSDPLGTISVINFVSGNAQSLSQSDITTIDFSRYDTTAYHPLIRVFGNNGQASFSEDMEPQGICFNNNGSKAFISLQENNALAIINLFPPSLDTIVGLGYKDHNVVDQGLDASDLKSGIDIRPHFNLFGMYQPDEIAWYSVAGSSYIVSANEGSGRNYGAYSEVERVNNVNLSPFTFNNSAQLQNDTVLGRLKVTTTLGKATNGIQHDSLFSFGTRSFSIWNEDGNLIWDSGDDFEQTLALLQASNFNSENNTNSSLKGRSDDSGPEPEAIALGQVDGKWYAFIGLNQMGGIMIYDIDNPQSPSFDSYILDRDFSKAANDTASGDLGPKHLLFIPANESPNGMALIIVSNEVSGNVSIYQVGQGIGLYEKENISPLEVYPNPSPGVFQLSHKATLRVYRADGSFVGEYSNQAQIDLSEEAAGLYLIKDEAGKALRIIKN